MNYSRVLFFSSHQNGITGFLIADEMLWEVFIENNSWYFRVISQHEQRGIWEIYTFFGKVHDSWSVTQNQNNGVVFLREKTRKHTSSLKN